MAQPIKKMMTMIRFNISIGETSSERSQFESHVAPPRREKTEPKKLQEAIMIRIMADKTIVLLWWAAPDSSVEREQAGRRPVLVISNARYHDAVTMLVVTVPVTSVDRHWPNHVRIPGGADLPRDSFAMTEQVRTISRARLVGRIGAVEADALADVLRWVRDWIV